MLLRRITQHIKDQNWFAVGIDFVIVVVGVFIGIQVANWNEARREREIEQIYLQRLQQELADMALQAETSAQNFSQRGDLIAQVRDHLRTGEAIDSLSGLHCGALVRSHIMAGVIFYPPTIKELIATGRIVLLRDNDLRTAILAFDQANEAMSQLRSDIQLDRLPLARKYPHLIKFDLVAWEDSVCDFEAMAADQRFLNDFADNYRRFMANVSAVEDAQANRLKALSAHVASNLSETLPDIAAEQSSETEQ